MDTEEELVLCTHCNKDVAKANFDLHEPHCKRFLCKCPDCNDTVHRDQLEEHKTEQHAEVKCKKCKKKMERRHLLDHENNECPERFEICEFCQLELPLSTLKVHKVSCGSRTERCSDCDQYVKMTDQIDHAQICPATTQTTSRDLVSKDDSSDLDEGTMLQCDNCLKYIPSDSLEIHKGNCPRDLHYVGSYDDNYDDDDDDDNNDDKKPKAGNNSDSGAAEFSFSSRHKTKGDKNSDTDLEKISTCRLCHLALPVKTLEWHEKRCELHRHLCTA
nr:Zgc:153893 [Danio rerio]